MEIGASSSGKTRVFGTRIRRFESCRPSHFNGVNKVSSRFITGIITSESSVLDLDDSYTGLGDEGYLLTGQ